MSARAATMATVVALLAAAPAAAAPSDLDTAFGTGGIALQAGIQTGALAVAAAPGGKIVVAGTDLSDGQKIAVARFDRAGHLDPTFDPAGTPGIASVAVGDNAADAEAVAVDSQGRVVVAGSAVSAGQPAIAVVRLTAGGVVDTSGPRMPPRLRPRRSWRPASCSRRSPRFHAPCKRRSSRSTSWGFDTGKPPARWASARPR
jgi:uncharacterized delta-60 repeat protein